MKQAVKFIRFSFVIFILCLIPISPSSASSDALPKIVYITFDDGPTYISNKLLDVLKEKNVKATFFVVGKEIEGREVILKRIYDEGHSIGLHTYSHSLRKIYKNQDTFIEEMLLTSQKVKEITGYTSHIIRFPGGSSRRLDESFLNKLHESNLKVYDWNSNIYDGDFPGLSAYRLAENAKTIKGNSDEIIILMHTNSNNKRTVEALPKIIDYYRNSGYKFLPITEDTKEYYYRF